MDARAFFAAMFLVLGTGCVGRGVSSPTVEVNDLVAGRVGAARLAALPFVREESGDAAEVAALVGKPLDVSSAVRIALLRNRGLRAAFHELGIARGELLQAGLLPNPAVDVGVRRSSDSLQPLQVDLGLEVEISALVLMPLRRGVAQANLEATRFRVAGEVLDTAYRARTLLYGAQARMQELMLQERVLATYQAGYAAAKELHRVGNLPDVDLAAHLAAVEVARLEVADAEIRLLDSREALTVVLGVSGDETNWTLPLVLPDPPLEAGVLERAEERAVAASLELAEIRARMDAGSRVSGLARTEGNMPHLSGGFHGEHDGYSWEIGGHLTVGLPVFDRNQGRVQSADAALLAERERYEAAALLLRSLVRTTQNRMDSAERRARHLRVTVLPAREKALAEALLQYNAMQMSVFSLLELQREVTKTQLSLVQTSLAYWNSRATLELLLSGRHRGVDLGVSSAPASIGATAPSAAGGGH